MQEDSFVIKHYKNFIIKNGYIPQMFNPYNETEIKDIAPTQSTYCGSMTSSASVLIVEKYISEEETMLRGGKQLTETIEKTLISLKKERY